MRASLCPSGPTESSGLFAGFWHNVAARCYHACLIVALLALPCMAGQAQLSLSAYRALGQPDLRQNGVNMVEAGTLFAPGAAALDSDGHLFVADTSNHRVLGWHSLTAVQNGDAATLVLGQPSPQHSNPYGIGIKGFALPWSVAVDPATGDLYVADFDSSRVLRFPKPFVNLSRIEPDAVYGQPDFATRIPNSNGVTSRSMNGPRGVAFDTQGNLWVADSGNNRLLRFPAGVLNTPNPAADLALGQRDLQSASPNGGGNVSASGFNLPAALTFDAQSNLYVADYYNTRVLKFPAPVTSNSAATVVYGEKDFTTIGIPPAATSSSMAGPAGVAVDGTGALYVAIPNNNRVLVFAPNAPSGAPATSVLGQPDFTTVTVNTGAFPQASAASLAGVAGLVADSKGDLVVADAANNRVLQFPSGAKAATRVLGQTDFAGNGPNQIKPGSINSPFKIAVDYSRAPFALYVSDTNNNRVLVWKDAAHFHTGDPADLVIGQPSLTSAVSNVDSGGTNAPSQTSLSAPRGIAVAADGTLYVADSGNHRVLRYPRPVGQSGRITPDAVLGQTDFTSAASAAVNAGSLHNPSGLAIGPNGNLFVADSGNNRVLEFKSGSATGANSIRVYGQPDSNTSTPPSQVSAQTLTGPQGLFVDAPYNLYVADRSSNRVVIYPNTSTAPPAGLAASVVLGQITFADASPGAGATGLNAPLDVALDSGGNIFVSDTGNNRVLVFPSLLTLLTGGAAPYSAYLAVGQQNLYGTVPNWNTPDGLATPEGLAGPAGVFVDRRDTLYVGDTGNNRGVQFLKPVAIVNAATSQATVPVGQGAWCTLYGAGLATTTQIAHSAALPTSLAGSQLVVNDQILAPLYYVSSGQINLVFPQHTPLGSQRIAARVADTGELLAGGTVSVAAYSPGFFTHDQTGTGQAAALNQDNSLNGPNHPAARGSIVQLFGTGQGPVVNPVADGQPAPNAPDKTVAVPTSDGPTCLGKQPSVCVAVGSTFADIQYSGLAPGLVGVWQVNIKIPSDSLTGNVPVRAVIGGANLSNIVTLAIQ
jgi:uncharacterized protein (TIGR03437 family)